MTQPSDLDALLASARKQVADPSRGLPDPVFRFVLQVTPMINVDLLVRNEKGEHLLSWREDAYDKGWHVPGGIIRFNEPIPARIAAVAREELTASVSHADQPQHMHQFFHRRGHFISLLFLCRLASPVSDPALLHTGGTPRHGQLRWIAGVPRDIYKVHSAYADWLDGRSAG
jgi:ADP-ribose pyrophosphatase YjhB (NUDIX family)